MIKEVRDFVYLCATVSDEGEAEKDMKNSLGKAKSMFGRLRKVWGSKRYSKRTKIRLYNTLVKPVLLYGCEAWKVSVVDNEKLDSFQYKCLKRLMGIYWPYIISKDELNERCGCESI